MVFIDDRGWKYTRADTASQKLENRKFRADGPLLREEGSCAESKHASFQQK
jgi:hypothetical protein